MGGKNWTCSYCNRPCTITENDIRVLSGSTWISPEYGQYRSITTIIVCPNELCRQRAISLRIVQLNNRAQEMHTLFSWQLLPESEAKTFPDYIPEKLRGEYQEACLLKAKSPRASAVISRKCIQAILRDFYGVSGPSLADEIDSLKGKMDNTAWQAIGIARQFGNIDSYLNEDVNLLLDVQPDEASLLIWLTETLFEEFYIARHERGSKLDKLKALARNKAG
ncbi:MAG: DUF4145 domain-containing protein [Syntrophaceae bacterium]